MNKLLHLKEKMFGKLTTFKTVICLVVATIVALILESCMLFTLNANSATKTLELLSKQVDSILENNEEEAANMLDSLKEEYIVRAKAVAHYLEANPDAESDITELVKLSDLLEIDEIHIFDESGTIIFGTEPKYYGYSFDSGEQMAYFKPMLANKDLAMCQDMMPNTVEQKNIMYAITWNEAGTEMIQVGITPTRLTDELKDNEIAETVENMPKYEGYDIYVVNRTNHVIEGATDKNVIGEDVDVIGLELNSEKIKKTGCQRVWVNSYRTFFQCSRTGDNLVIIVHSFKNDSSYIATVLLIEFAYLLISAIVIFIAVKRLIAANKEKQDRLDILKSMSDVYYSMHLINLYDDTVEEYKSKDYVKKVVNKTEGITKMMVQVMHETITDEYIDVMLEFTDLTTVRERMKNKKIITAEAVGKHFGWMSFNFITIDTDKYGMAHRLMFVSRCIDDEKKKEASLIRTSTTDELTGLFNRRAYENRMNELEEGTIPQDLVYFAFDVNGLKRTNDSLGHKAGDELIIAAANCITQIFGEYGSVYRIGGDEYIALVNVDAEQADRLVMAFNEKVDAWKGEIVDKMSVSCGYVRADSGECTEIRQIAILADKRMYANKSAYYRNSGIDRRRR